MSTQLIDLWTRTLQLVKDELTEVSFNTWIKSIKPIELKESKIILGVPNDFTKEILEGRYKDLLINSFKVVSNRQYEVDFIVGLTDVVVKEDSMSQNENNRISKTDATQALLNPKYTFGSFVIGNSNRFAHAACLAVAESPAKAYNPLFIYGGVGLGKTHLMHAIGHYVLKNNPKARVAYVSSEKFTNELINSIKDDTNVAFRNKYRNVDILLIDDIQFIAGKERTQEEFFHTFNALHESDKQIILSSDRPPKEIPTLEDRLRSRFEWGLIADIQAPDFETRIAILRKKADVDKLEISNDVLSYIANTIKSNIRELEGALIRIVAFSSLTNKEITVELAEEALKDIIANRVSKAITIRFIQDLVCKYFNVTLDELKSARRTKNITYPRQVAMYLCRKNTDNSLPKIGEEFGGRDHTTVIHSYEKISVALKNGEDQNLKNDIEVLTKKVNQK